jgi:parallel beta-helix repeat protein
MRVQHVSIVSLFLAMTLLFPTSTLARTRRVHCELGESVNATIREAKPGDVIVIHGTCHENVFVPPAKTALTIRGASAMSGITGIVSTLSVIFSSAPSVTIRRLIISGPGSGPTDGPDTDFNGTGINVREGAFMDVSDCIVENNRAEGISINGSNATLRGNTIRNNNRRGIQLLGGMQIIFNASAKLFNNVVEANNGYGISVRGQSDVFFSGNVVRNNGGDGITVRQMSLVHFEGEVDTVENNAAFGVRCDDESRRSGTPAASGNSSGNVACTHVH